MCKITVKEKKKKKKKKILVSMIWRGKVCNAPLKCGAKNEGSMNLRGKFALKILGAFNLCPTKSRSNTDFAPQNYGVMQT